MNINRALTLIINTKEALTLTRNTNVELIMNTDSINRYPANVENMVSS